MPSQTHPQAQFVPIPPNFDLAALVDSSDNFDYVTRLSTEKLKEHSIQSFEALILAVVIQTGKPLVIENWGDSLPPWLFNRDWLEASLGTKAEQVRDIPNEINIPMTVGHYLRSMNQLTNQFTKDNYRDPKRQRLYLKDIDCPDAWAEQLKSTIPECIYYLNECIESRTGGDGAILEPNEYGQMRYGKGVAPAGDLMSSLPPEMRALNMMCYIGHEGTYTPAHREMCATLGHNIMVEASKDEGGENEGSAIWFMTETKERELVSEYFLSMLGHDIEVEKHFAQVNAWKKAPFNVYVVEQRVGDLILIPPLAPHQVWNRGTRTMKVAWNRTTVDTLELALHEALPRGRLVCRDEQYKCKAIVYYTLLKYYNLLQRDTIEPKMWKYGRAKQLLEDFRRLFSLYQEILVSEMFSPRLPEESEVEMVPFDSNVTCSYCRLNIFNRFLTCKSCILYGPNGEEETYDICMDCYAMGRSCACISDLSWVEQWDWNVLVHNYEDWRGIVVQFDGFFDTMRSPQVLDVARKRYGKKPIAEVCQEQLRRRPWIDITKPKEPTPVLSDVEVDVDDEGRAKRPKRGKKATKRKNRLSAIKGKTHPCHICFHQEWDWKLAFCTTCSTAYCYGVLWRAFDLMPQAVMEDKDWQCPRCLKICSCSKCRKCAVQTPYKPKGTLLGHDTRKVADFRSVESLVDFSKTNLVWLKDDNAENPQKSGRMLRLKEKAEAEKARADLDDQGYLANDADGDPFVSSNDQDAHRIQDLDPSLRDPVPETSDANGNANENAHLGADYDPPPLYTPSDFAANDNMGEDIQNAWMHGNNYNFEEFYAENPQPASYPARLLAPVASMVSQTPTSAPAPVNSARPPESSQVTEPSDPDPSHVGQERMMGIGYYQQGDGIDSILFDPPNATGTPEQPPQPASSAQNPVLSLFDLRDPAMQPSEIKKRKRPGDDDEGEEEFFASKRQKMLALTKKHKSEAENVLSDIAVPEKRLPRRTTCKPQTYTDLGEDAIPPEEEAANLIPAYSYEPRPPKAAKHNDDLELAAQAMSNLDKPKGRRGRPKVSPKTNTIKTPRNSAWLARKEADNESDVDFSAGLPRRTRTKRTDIETGASPSNSEAAEISSEAGSGSDGEAAAVDHSNIEADKDSLFGEPLERENSEDGSEVPEAVRSCSEHEESTEPLPKSRPAPEDLKIAAKPTPKRRGRPPRERHDDPASEVGDKPTPKRRGRPPRERHDDPASKVGDKPTPKRRGRPPKPLPPTDTRSPSPPVFTAPKMMSLKERMALKGRSFKIVAKPKGTVATSSRPSSSRSTTSTMPKSISKQSSIVILVPVTRDQTRPTRTSSEDSLATSAMSSSKTTSGSTTSSSTTGPATANPSNSGLLTSSPPQTSGSSAPVRKGPTVVRLMSVDSEYDENNTPSSEPKSLQSGDESSSDEDFSC